MSAGWCTGELKLDQTIRYLACGDLENIIYRDSTGSKWIKKDQVRVPPRLVLRKGRERVL